MSRWRSVRLVVVTVMLLALILPVASAAIIWGPYVTNTMDKSAVVSWKTTSADEGWVEYVAEGGGTYQRIASPEKESMHHVLLTNLTPATTYRYRVGIGN